MPEVLRNVHFIVAVDPIARIVRVTRTAAPFDSLIANAPPRYR
ncbi:hypothetical protein WMF26_16245 [Sorangium sp. So ce185]